uniref:HAT C-terminal dimerisation domain-containing protein n=1 Tax=Musa acuminata subsp. malaccensis TaxID=214687 RepID=A0A804HMZ5_MUSAM
WETTIEIIKGVEPLYIVLYKVDMDKRPQMSYLKYMLISAREKVRRAFKDDFKADQYVRIIDHNKKIILIKLCLVAYYLNPAIQYRYALRTQNDFLTILRNVIFRLLPNTTNATDDLMEGRLFRETVGSFSDVVAVSYRYTMDPVMATIWKGCTIFKPYLRKVTVRVLSQTTSSGCERNWSTFALIHTKVHNKLSYRRLEKLVYVYYNMRLRLRCAELDKEPEESYIDLIDLQFYNEDSEPMLD